MATSVVPPKRIFLYEEPSSVALDLRAVAKHVADVVGVRPRLRKEFLLEHGSADFDSLAKKIAAIRVTDVAHPLARTVPPPALFLFERRQLESPERRVHGVLYDGMHLQHILRDLLPPDESALHCVHIAFTSRLVGTFDDGDRRYHARAVVLGTPSIVSTTGLVEGPAKPRGFYAAKRGLRIESADARYEVLKERFAGQFLDFDDSRLTQVAKGYALQSVFYQATGEPFCEDEDCVLFNAHWQGQLLHAQVESGRLCVRHRRVASTLRGDRKTRTR